MKFFGSALAELKNVVAEYANEYGLHEGEAPPLALPASEIDIKWLQEYFGGKTFGLDQLYRVAGAVSLPDVHCGYFVHSIPQIKRSLERGDPAEIEGGGKVIPFASDGGGGLIAIRLAQYPGRVDYLGRGRVCAGVLEPLPLLPRQLAAELPSFLRRLAADVSATIRQDAKWRYML